MRRGNQIRCEALSSVLSFFSATSVMNSRILEHKCKNLSYHMILHVSGARWLTQWQSVKLRSERSGVRNLPPPCCILEQDTLLPENTCNTQEAVAPSLYD